MTDVFVSFDRFNAFFSKKSSVFYNSFISLNMRSLSSNPSKLQNWLDTINYMFSVIGISLKKVSHAVDIDGYTSLHSYRTSQTGVTC